MRLLISYIDLRNPIPDSIVYNTNKTKIDYDDFAEIRKSIDPYNSRSGYNKDPIRILTITKLPIEEV